MPNGDIILLHPDPSPMKPADKYCCANPECYFGIPPSKLANFPQTCDKCKKRIEIGNPIRPGVLETDHTVKWVHTDCIFEDGTPLLSSVEKRRRYAELAQVEDDVEPFLKKQKLSFE